MVDAEKVKINAKKLGSVLSGREGKYVRNLNRYLNNGARREDLWTPYVSPQAYVSPAQGAEGIQTQINVIKSCIDTVASKISQANVRPYFIPSNGDYDTDRVCVKMQDYFDIFFDEQHAYPKSVMAFRDCATFDIGIMHVNAEAQSLEHVKPWEYFVDPSEYAAGAVSEAVWKRKWFPLAALKDRITNRQLKQDLDDNFYRKGEYNIVFDLYNGYKYEFFGAGWTQIADPIKLDYVQYGGLYRRPFVEMYYTKPMKGFYSVSLCDDLYPLQRQIDEIVRRLDAATRNAVLQMILVPKSSDLKPSIIENNVRAYGYTPGPDGGAPISISPPAINPQFIEFLSMYINQAYSIAGISQLSAQSKAPSNLDSGKALDTMEDIESDRFNVQLQQFTHFLVDVARVAIDCFPADKPILQKRKQEDKITWGDVRKQRDIFSIQFSAASSLSKDPNERFNQIAQLSSMGLIDKPMMKQFAQLPDLQGVYTIINSSYDYAQKVIDNTIKNGNDEFVETVDLVMLQDEVAKKMNMMLASGDKPEYISRLSILLGKVNQKINQIAPKVMPPPPPPPPEPVRDDGLESGQIQSLMQILTAVKSGQLDQATGAAVISAAFPKIPAPLLQGMLGPANQQIAGTPPVSGPPAIQGVANA